MGCGLRRARFANKPVGTSLVRRAFVASRHSTARTDTPRQPRTTVMAKSKKQTKVVNEDRRKNPEFGSYLLKILKMVHPDCSISAQGMWVVNGIASDFLSRSIEKSLKMAALEQKSTLKGKHAQAAIPGLMTGGLARQAVAEGTKAVTKFAACA